MTATPAFPERGCLDTLIWLNEEDALKNRIDNDVNKLINVLICDMDLSVSQIYDLPFKEWKDAGLKYGQYERMGKCLARRL